jgi:hypothetical protein
MERIPLRFGSQEVGTGSGTVACSPRTIICW